MNDIEYEVLSLYKKSPHKTFSTTEIVKAAEPKDYEAVDAILNNKLTTKEGIKQAKRDKAQLHRKVLYHLNKLVENGILRIEKEGHKGEKYFSIYIEEGEEISVDKYKKRAITISKPQTPSMPIEGYEGAGIVKKFEEATWIDRLNCIILEAEAIKEIERTFNIVEQSFSIVNDNIGINNFELLVQQSGPEEAIKLIDRTESECKDFAKDLTLIIELSKIGRTEIIQDFLKRFAERKYQNIRIVFNTDANDLTKYHNLILSVVDNFAKNGTTLYIKNNSITKSPYSIGKEGPYTLNEDEWRLYTTKIKGKTLSTSLAQTTIIIDVQKFYDKFGITAENFDKFMINCAEALLSANSLQRKKAPEYFSYLIELNRPNMREVFMFSRNYIRFQNYEYLKEKFDENFHLNLFSRVKEKLDDFCQTEETIYKSCGMPTRFNICFSTTKNQPIEIRNVEDIYKKELNTKLKSIEQLSQIMNGGIITKFMKQRNINPEDVLQELTTLINTHKIPLIAYTFRKVGAELKLSEFV